MAGIPLPKRCLEIENIFTFMIIPFQSIIDYKYPIKYDAYLPWTNLVVSEKFTCDTFQFPKTLSWNCMAWEFTSMKGSYNVIHLMSAVYM